MTIILHGSLMLRLLCALVGGVIYLAFVNSNPLRRRLRHNPDLRFLLFFSFVIIPLVFPTIGWIVNLTFITVFIYKVMHSRRR